MSAPVTATLLISCRDRRGLVAAVADFLYRNDGNILHADQHTDPEEGIFLQRVEWLLDGFKLGRDEIAEAFLPLAEQFELHWSLHFSDFVPKVAIFSSRMPHCLMDLLVRWSMGDLRASIDIVISNHDNARELVGHFGIDFEYLPTTPETKLQQERRALELLTRRGIDLVVLARYMQVLTPEFVAQYRDRTINIHHSFLPAFAGARPYHQAIERGVKIIGATAHYVTEGLDQGPIIEQDTARISHRDDVRALMRKGQDLEKIVLSRAVQLHLANRVLIYGGKTVVFD
jgi:formyltetrahydrofolate deformylase